MTQAEYTTRCRLAAIRCKILTLRDNISDREYHEDCSDAVVRAMLKLM